MLEVRRPTSTGRRPPLFGMCGSDGSNNGGNGGEMKETLTVTTVTSWGVEGWVGGNRRNVPAVLHLDAINLPFKGAFGTEELSINRGTMTRCQVRFIESLENATVVADTFLKHGLKSVSIIKTTTTYEKETYHPAEREAITP